MYQHYLINMCPEKGKTFPEEGKTLKYCGWLADTLLSPEHYQQEGQGTVGPPNSYILSRFFVTTADEDNTTLRQDMQL